MAQVTVKNTKKGWTVHVPASQIKVFTWILEEGLAGLSSIDYEDDPSEPIAANGHLAKWNGINYEL